MRLAWQSGLATVALLALLAADAQPQAAKQKTSKTKTTAKSTKAAAKSKPAAKNKAAAKEPANVVNVKPAEFVARSLAAGAAIPVENPAALVPFFEQLYRHQRGELPGPVRVLQYGDSHTAADEFSGELRNLFQASFGDGGSGFSFAGKPWTGYRRRDVKTGSTKGWHTDGLVTRQGGDGVYGLGGVSMTATAPRETVFIEADAQEFELFYYQQPGGGGLQLLDSGVPLDLISTSGEAGPGYYRVQAIPGPHRFELETTESGPVRLFGWVAENATGITYETFGINGAQATTIHQWEPATLRANLLHRSPDMIVLAYGTNEAGSSSWTVDSYEKMFADLLRQFRLAAPTASILVLGPPDRSQRIRRQWQTMSRIGIIAEAQRRAALEMGCAFVDLRAEMGGAGSMLEWVKAGEAQADHVHFTTSGYRLLGDAVYADLMSQYRKFLDVRATIMAEGARTGSKDPE
ncbi:MAG: GDSL-type esterase/lipase family protein [Acidobacteriota bacterium]